MTQVSLLACCKVHSNYELTVLKFASPIDHSQRHSFVRVIHEIQLIGFIICCHTVEHDLFMYCCTL